MSEGHEHETHGHKTITSSEHREERMDEEKESKAERKGTSIIKYSSG